METMNELPKLEARLFHSDIYHCELCCIDKEHDGGFAVSIAVKDLAESGVRFVCRDCATAIDPQLVDYVYNPKHKPPKKLPKLPDNLGYFGVCPECGTDGFYLNIRRDHWFCCAKHGLRWWAGSNLFSAWRDETEETWNKNRIYLAMFREIESVTPKRQRGEQLRARLR